MRTYLFNISKQEIIVFIEETIDVIGDVASVMAQPEFLLTNQRAPIYFVLLYIRTILEPRKCSVHILSRVPSIKILDCVCLRHEIII